MAGVEPAAPLLLHQETIMMNIRTLAACSAITLSALAFGGCAGMSETTKGTAVGAAVGAVGGSVLGGGAVGTVGGAVVGGVIGREVGKDREGK